jgi:hypothetical protein
MKKIVLALITISFASVQANWWDDVKSTVSNTASKVSDTVKSGAQTVQEKSKEAIDAAKRTGEYAVNTPVKQQAQDFKQGVQQKVDQLQQPNATEFGMEETSIYR